jgi:hypothetical protein
LCESKGIPSNIGADYCVGVGLNTLSEADFGKNVPLLGKHTGTGLGGVQPVIFDHKKVSSVLVAVFGLRERNTHVIVHSFLEKL